MPELLAYLLKVNLSLILFLLAYWLVLSQLTFYKLNRYFLLFSLIFSVVYPLISFSWFFQQPSDVVMSVIQMIDFTPALQNQEVYASQAQQVDYWQLVLILFWCGLVLMVWRLTKQIISLYFLHRKSKPVQTEGINYRMISENLNPFSFWRQIYINPALYDQQELNNIVIHEQIHVRQWHTLDIILAELLLLCCWFNPAAWLFRRGIKDNLEFITDQELVAAGTDIKAYQYSLIRISTISQSNTLVTNFNFSTIKKRIAMMNQPRSSGKQVYRYVLLLPVLITASFAFTASKAQTELKAMTTNVSNGIAAIQDALPAYKTSATAPVMLKNAYTKSVITKQKAAYNPEKHVEINAARQATYNTYFLDGKEITQEAYNKLNDNDIFSTYVVILDKDKTKAISGETSLVAIIVTTKKNVNAPGVLNFNRIHGADGSAAKTVLDSGEQNKINLTIGDLDSCRIIIDGQASDFAAFTKLMDTGSIKHVSVVKNPSDRSGKTGKGVANITTIEGAAKKNAADSNRESGINP